MARPSSSANTGWTCGLVDEMTVGTDGRPFEEASRTREREVHVFGEGDGAVVPDRARDGVAHVHGLQGTGSWVASNP